jgi:hypothetical protein
MDLDDALVQISEIRRQMARTQVFRGYRAITTGISALAAMVAAIIQYFWIPQPLGHITAYLTLWAVVAILSIVIVGVAMVVRCWRSESSLQREIALLAAEQFVPSLVAGGLLTYVLHQFAWEQLWMLPGLWAVLFSLGIFASRRLLPKLTLAVAGYYLLAGLVCLAKAKGEHAFSPWAMALTFGVGQLLASAVLWWTLEREYGRQ